MPSTCIVTEKVESASVSVMASSRARKLLLTNRERVERSAMDVICSKKLPMSTDKTESHRGSKWWMPVSSNTIDSPLGMASATRPAVDELAEISSRIRCPSTKVATYRETVAL